MKKKTKVLYCYITSKSRDYVKQMRPLFKTESNYVNLLIEKDLLSQKLRNKKLKQIRKIKRLSDAINCEIKGG